MSPDSDMDRCAAAGATRQGLVTWANTYGLNDAWRWKNPLSPAFTCHSASHKSILRIDLAYVGAPVLSRVRDITILPRGISDHVPLHLTLDLSADPSDSLWRLSRFWVSDTEVESQFRSVLETYWRVNPGSAAVTSVWDDFKAYSRGSINPLLLVLGGSAG